MNTSGISARPPSPYKLSHLSPRYPRTMSGKIWWRTVGTRAGCRIQQNILSQHYRVLDSEDGRVCSSFDLEEIYRRLDDLEKEGVL